MNGELIYLEKVLPHKKKEKIWIKQSHNLVLHVPTGCFYARKSKAGKGRFFQSTGFKTKGKAQTQADEMIAEWLGGKRNTGRRLRVSPVVDEMLAALKKEANTLGQDGYPLRSAATYDHDKYYARVIKKLFGGDFIDQWSEQWWDEWIKNTGVNLGRTLADIAKYVSKTHSFAFSKTYVKGRITFKNPDKPKKVGIAYTDEQIQMFFEKAEPTLQDMIALGVSTGMRPEEVDGLEWAFVQFRKSQVVLSLPEWFVKCGPGREFMVPKMAADVLKRRYKERQSLFVFPAPLNSKKPMSKKQRGKMWRRMLINAGVIQVKYEVKKGTKDKRGKKVLIHPPVPFKFHYFRHTFSTRAILVEEKPLAKVASYVGNSPKVLFDRYAKANAGNTVEISETMSGLKLSGGKVVDNEK
jgi:integrase